MAGQDTELSAASRGAHLEPPIGGFFGLEPPGGGRAVFESSALLSFWNARAAMAHLLASLQVGRVWLPAYVCREPAEAAARNGCDVQFYGVGERLSADSARLSADLRPGDAVLVIDYFGAPTPALAAVAADRPDVVWIQDRAQALWPDPDAWGRYLVYSPRKVVGAPDGGILVSRVGPLAPPAWLFDEDEARLEPARMRSVDPEGRCNDVWFPVYRAVEAAMTCEPRPMSVASKAVVGGADTAGLASRRRENARRVLEAVADCALWPAEQLLAGAPLGVPVIVSDAGVVAARMARERVFCARHWAELPSPAAEFPAEHALSRRLLTLPCDHRYSVDQMARVVEVFRACR